MVTIERKYDSVIFHVKGWDKFFAFKSSLEIPVEHINLVYADPSIEIGFLNNVKLLGTSVPNFFMAGTFYQQGEVVFWDVRNTANAIVVELEHEYFKKLVIEVEDPATAINIIKGKL